MPNRLGELEHRLPRLVPPPGACIPAPSRILFAVDRKGHRPSDAAIAALVDVRRREFGLLGFKISRRRDDFHLLAFLGVRRRSDLDLEFAQSAGAVDRPARASARQIRMHQQLKLHGGDALFFRFPVHLNAVFGRCVALRE